MFRCGLFGAICLAAVFGGFLAYEAVGFGKSGSSPEFQHFSLPDLEGVSRDIDEWRGKVIVINFWATWCPPCLEEIPLFMEIQDTYAAQGLQFIGIAIEDPEPVREWTERIKINYPVLIAGMSGLGLAAAFGNRAGVVPYSVVVDREGQIVQTHPGLFPLSEIQEKVIPLL
jgi:thiol-disulfide isomerase/thioredoxin